MDTTSCIRYSGRFSVKNAPLRCNLPPQNPWKSKRANQGNILSWTAENSKEGEALCYPSHSGQRERVLPWQHPIAEGKVGVRISTSTGSWYWWTPLQRWTLVRAGLKGLDSLSGGCGANGTVIYPVHVCIYKNKTPALTAGLA